MHRSKHAGIGVPEFLEVVVRGVLATEGGLVLGHLRLDEGVAHAGAHRGAALFLNELRHGLGGNQVVNDGSAGELLQVALSHQRTDGRRRNRLALFIHHEAAVRIAVEGQTNISLLIHGELLQIHQVLWFQGVRLVVRESAIELEVQIADVERQAIEDGRHGVATHAVGGIDSHDERLGILQWYQLAQEVGVAGQNLLLGNCALGAGELRGAVDKHLLNLLQAGLLAHRYRAGAAEFNAVVLGWVMGSGKHSARTLQGTGGVVELVGRG